jgi:hypothetical protein
MCDSLPYVLPYTVGTYYLWQQCMHSTYSAQTQAELV